jgi:hypothetical protein
MHKTSQTYRRLHRSFHDWLSWVGAGARWGSHAREFFPVSQSIEIRCSRPGMSSSFLVYDPITWFLTCVRCRWGEYLHLVIESHGNRQDRPSKISLVFEHQGTSHPSWTTAIFHCTCLSSNIAWQQSHAPTVPTPSSEPLPKPQSLMVNTYTPKWVR